MNLRQFIKGTIENGGASYNLMDGNFNPKTGYMVAKPGAEMIIELSNGRDVYNITKAVKMFIKDHIRDILASDQNYIGSWISDNKLYLDISLRYMNRDVALLRGEQFNQLAIWDCEKGKTINL